MTLNQLITSIRYTIKDTKFSKFDSNNLELVDYIQRAYEMVYQRLAVLQSTLLMTDYPQDLTAGLSGYLLPSDFMNFGYCQIEGQPKPMTPVDYSHIETYNDSFGSTPGVPSMFAIYRGILYIKPDPADAYVLNEHYIPNPLTLTGTGVMPFGGIFNRGIQRWVERMALNRDEFNIQVEDAETKMLMNFAEGVHRARTRNLRRIPAYRWEYQGLI